MTLLGPAELGSETIDQLIISSPYEEPSEHWSYDTDNGRFYRKQGRRPAGFLVASRSASSPNDPGVFYELPLVNKIRPRIKAWRDSGYPGATSVTKDLLAHWKDDQRLDQKFFFCQIEAIETLMWMVESPQTDRQGVDIPNDGGAFNRLASKLATGGGKTLVMGMLIAWQSINATTYPRLGRYLSNFLVVTPGLTVKSRLAVLNPGSEGNIYDEFDLIPPGMSERLNRSNIKIINWHNLLWDSEEQIAKRKGVDKRGALSDEAFAREVLGEFSGNRNFLVINDEAHHAWRLPEGMKANKQVSDQTRWMSGLDRIHSARNIRLCYDFSATPFVPIGKENTEERVFGWIVSDFGLNDAIESGLVKTPRVVYRDDAVPDSATFQSKLFHIYRDHEVQDNLDRKAEEYEGLPDLVTNAYQLLGADWAATEEEWRVNGGAETPPVMISVVNNTYTAARVKYAFDQQNIRIPGMDNPDHTLHIDSRALSKAEQIDDLADPRSVDEALDGVDPSNLTQQQRWELMRQTVGTVGKVGEPGEQINNVISVAMLSEGWDCRTVTHIMGLRAFDSQLLCEQVVGRGLRRTSYDDFDEKGLFRPEYVNVFGVPFTFLPHEGQKGDRPKSTANKMRVEALQSRANFEIEWPNVQRINPRFRARIELDWDKVEPLLLDSGSVPTTADMAEVIGGEMFLANLKTIDIEKLVDQIRLQSLIFRDARNLFNELNSQWRGNQISLMAQLIRLVEEFIESDRIQISPPSSDLIQVTGK